MDSADFITLVLLDKGYYDYDYEMPKKKRRKPTKEERERWSDERLRAVLGRAVLPDGRKVIGGNGCSPEVMQQIVMEEAEEKRKAQQ